MCSLSSTRMVTKGTIANGAVGDARVHRERRVATRLIGTADVFLNKPS